MSFYIVAVGGDYTFTLTGTVDGVTPTRSKSVNFDVGVFSFTASTLEN